MSRQTPSVAFWMLSSRSDFNECDACSRRDLGPLLYDEMVIRTMTTVRAAPPASHALERDANKTMVTNRLPRRWTCSVRGDNDVCPQRGPSRGGARGATWKINQAPFRPMAGSSVRPDCWCRQKRKRSFCWNPCSDWRGEVSDVRSEVMVIVWSRAGLILFLDGNYL